MGQIWDIIRSDGSPSQNEQAYDFKSLKCVQFGAQLTQQEVKSDLSCVHIQRKDQVSRYSVRTLTVVELGQ